MTIPVGTRRGRYWKYVHIGPFVGGLNTASDPAAVAESELTDCFNLELDIDGSIGCRPPIKTTGNDMSATWTERIVALGSCMLPNGTYVIGSNANGVYQFKNNTWTLITGTFQASCFIQYNNKIWLVAMPGSANPGGSWDGTTFTAIATMPKGQAAIVYKERMWITPGITATTNQGRLSFCAIADPSTWNAADFFDVGPGDGQNLVDFLVFNNNLLLFKNSSTYALSYDTKPTDAVITNISRTIGVSTQRCCIDLKNQIFVFFDSDVYQLVNYNWVQITVKINFGYDATAPATRYENVFMSHIGNRIIMRYYNTVHVYNVNTKVWTKWKSDDPELHNFGPIVSYPTNPTQFANDQYYAGSSISNGKKFFVIADGWDSVTSEMNGATPVNITCYLKTKNFDMGLPFKFKRMFWWGADAVTNKQIIGVVTPIVIGSQTAWQDLAMITWNQTATWQTPKSNTAVTTTIGASGTGTLRRFFKFLKGVRYRQITFEVTMTSDGTTNDGPARLYTLVAVTVPNETVVASVG